MAKSLPDLREEIMASGHTAEEWARLNADVSKALLEATEDDVQDFVDSGAGEMLDMACSAIRIIQGKH